MHSGRHGQTAWESACSSADAPAARQEPPATCPAPSPQPRLRLLQRCAPASETPVAQAPQRGAAHACTLRCVCVSCMPPPLTPLALGQAPGHHVRLLSSLDVPGDSGALQDRCRRRTRHTRFARHASHSSSPQRSPAREAGARLCCSRRLTWRPEGLWGELAASAQIAIVAGATQGQAAAASSIYS